MSKLLLIFAQIISLDLINNVNLSLNITDNTYSGGFNNKIFTVELPIGMKAECNEPQKAILRIYGNLNEDYELPEGIISAILAERFY